MLKGNNKGIISIHSIFKIVSIIGIGIVLISGLSIYRQTYSLDIKNFGSGEDTLLYNIQMINSNVSSSPYLLQSIKGFANTIIVKIDETKDSLKRKSSLLSVVYETNPAVNENFATMTIYKLNRILPIIQGTEEKQLSQGVGHVLSSVLPGENDNLVLAGHRETSFRGLDKLIIGDLIHIQTDLGEFIYEVDNTRIVEDNDTSVIISTDYASLTLVTCYPFNWVGSAPQRYIVTATLIQSKIE